MTKKLDTFGVAYDLTTQRQVSLLIAAPIVVGAISLGVNYSGLTGVSIMGVPLIALPFWVMNAMVRENGKTYARRHPDGTPSTKALRASVPGFEASDRRQRIQAITGVKLASKNSEEANPQDADAKIVRAVDDLRAKLRGHPDCHVLRRELKSYGFWRNMVGNRPLGISVSAVGVVVAGFAAWHAAWGGLQVLSLLICLVSLLFWLFSVNNKRYSIAAERYSDELFRSMAYLEK